MNDKLHLFYATDNGYLIPTLVSAASAVLWASDRSALRIVVLDTGIDDLKWHDFKQRLRGIGGDEFEIVRHKIEMERIVGFKAYKGSVGAYARLLIPHDFPDISWCIYADGDTLFTDDPLKLEVEYHSRFAIQGQPDNENFVCDENGISNKQHWFENNGLGWDSSQYVCSGFLLMNLDWFRKNNGTERCLSFLMDYPDCLNHDQDALSYVCRGQIGYIADEWGRFSRNAFRGTRPGCLHYAADAPWKLMVSHRRDYNDAHKLWFDFAQQCFGFSMKELLTEPFNVKVFRRKVLFRYVFKMLFPVFRMTGFASPVGRYLRKHYASSVEYDKGLSCLPLRVRR